VNALNLYFYADRTGPNQLERTIDSPMLEQADERRFAFSQLGSQGANFEVEHTARVDLALQTLFRHFDAHVSHEPDRPCSPYHAELAGLRHVHRDDEPLDLRISSPVPRKKRERASPGPPSIHHPRPRTQPFTQAIAIQDLIHPEPEPSRAINDLVPDEASSDLSGINWDRSGHGGLNNEVLVRQTLTYPRANDLPPPRVVRAYRPVRAKRNSRSCSGRRRQAIQRGIDAEEQKEAHLLLALTNGHGPPPG